MAGYEMCFFELSVRVITACRRTLPKFQTFRKSKNDDPKGRHCLLAPFSVLLVPILVCYQFTISRRALPDAHPSILNGSYGSGYMLTSVNMECMLCNIRCSLEMETRICK